MVSKIKKVVYKVTYPNGKIYIGKDLTNTLTYFGSVNSKEVEKDFTEEEQQDFSIRKEVLFSSDSTKDVNAAETRLIRKYSSNDPDVGYNRWPKFK
ncbi:MAG: GIY-YIG nuclease family protein [Alphaproteobacteria bacterium]